MGLDYKPLGNPKWGKGMPSANPLGRPKGPTKARLDSKRRLLGKWRTHPVDKLVKIANFIEATNPEMAAKIWIRLLDSCELEERKRKDTLPPVSEGEIETPTEEEALRILKEIENGQQEALAGSHSNGLATGTTPIQVETGPTEDLSGHKE
jgi:hypothetical protein